VADSEPAGREYTQDAAGPVGRAAPNSEQPEPAGFPCRTATLPCWELFGQQSSEYRAAVLGAAPRWGIEAACGFGWERWLGDGGTFIGMDGFGASAPGEHLFRHFGITPEAITTAVRKRLTPQEEDTYGR